MNLTTTSPSRIAVSATTAQVVTSVTMSAVAKAPVVQLLLSIGGEIRPHQKIDAAYFFIRLRLLLPLRRHLRTRIDRQESLFYRLWMFRILLVRKQIFLR